MLLYWDLVNPFTHRIPSDKRVREDSDVPIHFSQVRCSGEQRSLLDCPLSEITEQCTHNQDAAIVCRRGRACEYIRSWMWTCLFTRRLSYLIMIWESVVHKGVKIGAWCIYSGWVSLSRHLIQLVMFVWWVTSEIQWEQWSSTTPWPGGLGSVPMPTTSTCGETTGVLLRLCVHNLATWEELLTSRGLLAAWDFPQAVAYAMMLGLTSPPNDFISCWHHTYIYTSCGRS
jgi:hypothetical protein